MMKKTIYLLVAGLTFMMFACNEEENHENPAISFIETTGYTFQDATLKVGETILVGIKASSGSDVNLTNLNYSVTADGQETSIDSGVNTELLEWEIEIEKGIAETEIWVFSVSDKDGRTSELSLNLKKDTASVYGSITRYTNVVMGAQDNVNGSFFSFVEGQVITLADAFANQEKINLVYFYDEVASDENALASPGANFDEDVFAGQYSITGWTTTNTTRYESRGLTQEEFNAAENDSLILATTFEYASGKRKAKMLAEGDVYAFVSEEHKGLLYIKAVDGASEGTLTLDLIISE